MSAPREDAYPLPPQWQTRVDALRLDFTHGASQLAYLAAAILADCAGEALAHARQEQARGSSLPLNDLLADLAALAWALVWARPSMAAIANTVAAIWRAATSTRSADGAHEGADELEALIERIRAEAERHRAGWDGVRDELSRRVRPLLREPVFTLSRSGSVERALVEAAQARAAEAPLRVIVAESRPGSEGLALASALRSAGARVSVVTDSAVGMSMDGAGMLLMGVDSIRPDGAVINKVGSYPAALVATDLGVPVFALCERLKITPASYPLTLERVASGVAPSDGVVWTDGAPLFDVTPARLVTAVITERGALTLADITRKAERAELALATLTDWVTRTHAFQPGG